MSDFYSKKQKKWWCEQCKKFIEYSHMSIDQHKRSKNHQRMLGMNLAYEHRKAKAQRIMNNGEENPPGIGLQNSFPNINHQFGQYRGKKQSGNESIMSHRETYSMSNNLLEEIKLEKLQEEQEKMFGKGYLGKKKNREWGEFYDDSSQRVFYYNFRTRSSQWEKPDNYDGPDTAPPNINQTEEINENEEFNAESPVPEVGLIGQWQDVDPKESFFEKNKAKDPLAGERLYSEMEFIRYNQSGDYDDKDEDDQEEEEKEIFDREIPSATLPKNYNKGTIDDHIIGNQTKAISQETFIPNLDKNELIGLNEKLKRRDYDMRYQSKEFTKEEKNINNLVVGQKCDELKEGETITFQFRQKKSDAPTKSGKRIFFDD